MKKIKHVIMLLVLILSFNTNSFAEDKPNTLTLEQAQNEAIKNSSVIKEDLRAIDDNNDKYEQWYREERQMLKNKEYGGSIETFNMEAGYNVKKNDNMVAVGKLKLKRDEETTKITLRDAYNEVIIRQKQLELNTIDLDNQKRNLDVATIKAKYGKISTKDYNDLKNKYKLSQISLDDAKKSIEDAYKSLNKLRGAKSEDRPKLVLDKQIVPLEKIINPKDAYENALKNKIDIMSLKTEVELSAIDLKSTSYIYPEITYKYAEKDRADKATKTKYEDYLINLKNGLEKAYDELMDYKNTKEKQEIALDKSNKDVDQKTILFKYGRISLNDLNTAKRDLINNEVASLKSTLDYQKKVSEYILNYNY